MNDVKIVISSEKASYREHLICFVREINERLNKQPSLLLLVNLVYWGLYFFGKIMPGTIPVIVSKSTEIALALCVFFSVLYFVVAKIGKTRKLFPIVMILILLTLLFFLNLPDLKYMMYYLEEIGINSFNYKDFEDWLDIILIAPIFISKILLFFWLISRAMVLRYEIKNDDMKTDDAFRGVIYLGLGIGVLIVCALIYRLFGTRISKEVGQMLVMSFFIYASTMGCMKFVLLNFYYFYVVWSGIDDEAIYEKYNKGFEKVLEEFEGFEEDESIDDQ